MFIKIIIYIIKYISKLNNYNNFNNTKLKRQDQILRIFGLR